MIILEDPYVSPELAAFAADRQEPVLDTPAARQAGLDYGLHLNLVSSRDFGHLCCRGQRLYSNSENALDWLYSRSGNAGLVRATELLKNKLLFRRRLAPLFPDFHFRELTLREVMETHFDSLPGPCVLKPAVGFFSLGVYSIENARQWRAARDDIAAGAVRWRKEYPAAVLDNQVWLLESLIQGTEYAVDVYFNSRGEAVICNILQHDFASSEDVSDRLYYTSADIIRRMAGPLEAWFDRLNERLGLRDYPVHVELRRDADGHMVPIEFNPLRFAGWCCTDISLFAWGFPTYGCYLGARTGTASCPATRTGSTPSSCSTSPPPARRCGVSTTTPSAPASARSCTCAAASMTAIPTSASCSPRPRPMTGRNWTPSCVTTCWASSSPKTTRRRPRPDKQTKEAPMKKIGIIRCMQTEDICPGTTDFSFAAQGKGAFEELGPCEVIGFVSCGGCPGKRAVARARMLVDRGAEAVALASCIRKGNPIGFPCPHHETMIAAIRAKLGDSVPVLDHTH